MLAAIKQLFSPALRRKQAHAAYVQIVAQARSPVFYRDWEIEDSVDGRFDIIIVHMFLVLARCEDAPDDAVAQDFYRDLAEIFFDDMDRSLREMGASDTGVGIRVKKMAQAFYGRMNAYREALGNESAMAEALKRNAYRERAVRAESVASLAAYIGRNHQALRLQSLDAITSGQISFSS
jgi:cytochrome b pre-mRNA-processing protein 3